MLILTYIVNIIYPKVHSVVELIDVLKYNKSITVLTLNLNKMLQYFFANVELNKWPATHG